MAHTDSPATDPARPCIYAIRIQGQLGPQWADWFDGLSITLEQGGVTLLTGPVADQAALHGLLRTIRDLGTPLLSVTRMEPDQTTHRLPDYEPGHTTEARHSALERSKPMQSTTAALGNMQLKHQAAARSPQALARFVGLLYLVIVVAAIVAHFYVPSQLLVPGDAAATAGNIQASGTLFRVGIGSEVVVLLSEIVLSITLGVLFLIAACGYLIDSTGLLLVPGYDTTPVFLALPIAIAEIAFPLWLLIRGVNVEQWNKRALAAA